MSTLDGHVQLDAITFQSRQTFDLPWTELTGDGVRFTDRGWLGRQLRMVASSAIFTFAIFCLGIIGIEIYYEGANAHRQVILRFGALAAISVVIGVVLFGWARTRFIEIDPTGAVRIEAPGKTNRVMSAGRPRLELREVHARAYRDRWTAYGLLISDGHSWALLALCSSREDCLDAFLSLPPQIQRIPLHEPRERLHATIHWV